METRLPRRVAMNIALIYLFVATLWILFSDWAVSLITGSPVDVTIFQTAKGMTFVLVTSYILYHLIKRRVEELEANRAVLARQESLYRTVISEASDGIAVMTGEGVVTDANQRLCEITGYSREELLDRPIEELVDARELDAPPLEMDALHDGSSLLTERPLLRKDGTSTYAEISASAVTGGYIVALIRDVSERRKAQEELHRAYDRLNALVQSSPLAIITLDADGKVSELWNPAAESMFGWNAEEVRGKPIPYLRAEDTENFEALRNEVMRGNSFTNLELTRQRRDKSPVHISLSTAPLRDSNGVITGVMAVIADVTERRREQEMLRTTQALLANLMRHSPAPIYVTSPDHRYQHMNPVCEQYFGRSTEELTGRSIHELLPEETAGWLCRVNESVLNSASPLILEETLSFGGAPHHFMTSKFPLFDSEGHVTGVAGVSLDVTEHRGAQQQRWESERRYRLMFQQNPLPMYVFDQETLHFLMVNDAALRQYQYTEEEFLEMKLTDLRSAEESERLLAHLADGGHSITDRGVWEHRRKDGSVLYAEIVGHEIEVAGRPATIVMANDVTERIRIEEERRQLNAELEARVVERTAQLEAANRELRAFTYSVSHDLRAPLRAIDGFSRIIRDDYEAALPAEAKEYFELICQSVENMNALIDDMLAFSRVSRQELSRQEVDMAALARQVYDDLAEYWRGRRIDFEVAALPPIQADPSMVRQVFANLLTNALKFTRSRELATISVGWEEHQGRTVYAIRDNGVGFDPYYAEKMFGVFQRLHRSEDYEGTGVGLAIVQRIVHRHGGRVWAESEQDNGATFYFTLDGIADYE